MHHPLIWHVCLLSKKCQNSTVDFLPVVSLTYATTYFFGVQLLNGLAEDEEVIIEQHQPSFVPLRDMVKDTTKLLEHLKGKYTYRY